MILGIGTDIVNTDRIAETIEKHGQRFLDRCFTKAEQEDSLKYKTKDMQLSYLAKRWAAKEACAKAFGTGIGEIVGFQDIDVSEHSDTGKPLIKVTGSAKKHLLAMCSNKEAKIDVSLSDEKDLALAFVVISVI